WPRGEGLPDPGPAAGILQVRVFDSPCLDVRHAHGSVKGAPMATTTLTPAASAYRTGLYEWLTTTDHKKIGILYLVNSFIFFFIGGLFALGVRTELAQPGLQLLSDELLYNQLFTMHGTVMIFLFIIPVLVGFGNYVVPLQIGAPDMAFPRIN